jgi:hypothetical protein
MIVEIPVRSDLPFNRFRIDLESITYIFRFKYNSRFERWKLDVLSSDETVLFAGIPMQSQVLLNKQFKNDDMPPGLLTLLPVENTNQEMQKEEFGTTFLLIYNESE